MQGEFQMFLVIELDTAIDLPSHLRSFVLGRSPNFPPWALVMLAMERNPHNLFHDEIASSVPFIQNDPVLGKD
jgi:hypothetical protein